MIEPELLIQRRGADDVTGLEILRRVAGVCGRDADDSADAQWQRAHTYRPSSPRPRRARQVRMSVAIVMPEIGFEEEPMRPVMRDETVEKKKPNITISTAASTLPCSGMPGRNREEQRQQQRCRSSTTLIGISRSVPDLAPAVAATPMLFRPPSAELMIVGIVRASVISPAASTAPAPM